MVSICDSSFRQLEPYEKVDARYVHQLLTVKRHVTYCHAQIRLAAYVRAGDCVGNALSTNKSHVTRDKERTTVVIFYLLSFSTCIVHSIIAITEQQELTPTQQAHQCFILGRRLLPSQCAKRSL